MSQLMQNALAIALIAAAVVLAVGIVIILVQRFGVAHVAKVSGLLTLETIKAINHNPALLDAIESNKTQVPVGAYRITAGLMTFTMGMFATLASNPETAAQAATLAKEWAKFGQYIGDGVIPNVGSTEDDDESDGGTPLDPTRLAQKLGVKPIGAATLNNALGKAFDSSVSPKQTRPVEPPSPVAGDKA